jgi:hypothetical protein
MMTSPVYCLSPLRTRQNNAKVGKIKQRNSHCCVELGFRCIVRLFGVVARSLAFSQKPREVLWAHQITLGVMFIDTKVGG